MPNEPNKLWRTDSIVIPTSFLQMPDVHICVNIRVSVLTRVAGNSDSLFKMAESLLTMKDSFIFLIFLCVRIEINSHWQ